MLNQRPEHTQIGQMRFRLEMLPPVERTLLGRSLLLTDKAHEGVQSPLLPLHRNGFDLPNLLVPEVLKIKLMFGSIGVDHVEGNAVNQIKARALSNSDSDPVTPRTDKEILNFDVHHIISNIESGVLKSFDYFLVHFRNVLDLGRGLCFEAEEAEGTLYFQAESGPLDFAEVFHVCDSALALSAGYPCALDVHHLIHLLYLLQMISFPFQVLTSPHFHLFSRFPG